MIDQFKKYAYRELEYSATGQRSCYIVGRVYKYRTTSGNSERYLMNGDLLLCIRKSGDCHYDFARLRKTAETGYSGSISYQLFAYFELLDKVSQYGGMDEAFPKMETLSELDMVHALYSDQVLIPLFATLSDSQVEAMVNLSNAQKVYVSIPKTY